MDIKHLLELAGTANLPRSRLLIDINEGFKEAQIEFAEASSDADAQQAITQFRDLVNRNQVQGNERNIDYWRKQGWDAFNQFVSTKSQEKSTTQEKRSKSAGRSITLHEDDNWLVVVPLDKDASCFHGKNTDWCTTKPTRRYFESYFYSDQITLIYFLQLDTGNKWAIAYHDKANGYMELFDKQDKMIEVDQFTQQTGFDPYVYTRKAGLPDVRASVNASRAEYQRAMERIRALSPFKELPPDTDLGELERDLWLTKNELMILRYCTNVKGRWPKIEKVIDDDLDYAVQYAKDVIKGRWPEIEGRLLDSDDGLYAAVNYAADVVKGAWPDLEERLYDQPDLAIKYALDASGRRLPADLERKAMAKASMAEREEYRDYFL